MPDRIDNFIAEERYMSASKVLVTALDHLENDLKEVDGLVEIRATIDKKRDLLHKKLVGDFTRVLYQETQAEILRFYTSSFGSHAHHPHPRGGSSRFNKRRHHFGGVGFDAVGVAADFAKLRALPFRGKFVGDIKLLKG